MQERQDPHTFLQPMFEQNAPQDDMDRMQLMADDDGFRNPIAPYPESVSPPTQPGGQESVAAGPEATLR